MRKICLLHDMIIYNYLIIQTSLLPFGHYLHVLGLLHSHDKLSKRGFVFF